MIAKKEVKAVDLTRELCKQFANKASFKGERQLRTKRIEFLYKHLRRGTFHDPDWAVAVDLSTGIEYRANGQHSSNMLAGLPSEEFPKGLKAYIAVYEITSLAEDALALFELFDNPASVRTNEDVMGVGSAQYPELDHVERSFLMHVAKAISAFRTATNEERRVAYVKARKKNPDAPKPVREVTFPARDHAAYWAEQSNREFAIWLNGMRTAGGKPVKNQYMFGLAGISSVMLGDWLRDPKFASRFWLLALTESHPEADDLSRELAQKLGEMRKQETKKQQHKLRAEALKISKRAAMMELARASTQMNFSQPQAPSQPQQAETNAAA